MAKICGFCEKSTVEDVKVKNNKAEGLCRCSVTGQIHEDHHQCDVPEKPRLCEVLGVAVGERFEVRDDVSRDTLGPFYIAADGTLITPHGLEAGLEGWAMIEAINHPEKIVRLSRLTPEEIQRCKAFGAKWVSRDDIRDTVDLWEEKPKVIPTELKCGIYGSAKRCAQTWTEYFPSVRPGQLVKVEDEPSEGAEGK